MTLQLNLVEWAGTTAALHLRSLPQRWQHVQGTARLAAAVADAYPGQQDQLVAGLLVHDIGYAPGLATSGFHPLDGARFVRDEGWPEVARLVAHHTGARVEAKLRGLPELEKEFPAPEPELGDALTYCDLTTSPTGSRIRLSDRVAEIQHRYGHDHVTSRAIRACLPDFESLVQHVEARLTLAGVKVTGSLAYPE
jgi:hypothetical protein